MPRTDTERAVLEKLAATAWADPSFTVDEVEMLRRIIDAAHVLVALGRFGKWAIFILAAIEGGLKAWEEIRAYFGGPLS